MLRGLKASEGRHFEDIQGLKGGRRPRLRKIAKAHVFVDHIVPVIFSRLIDGLSHIAEGAIMHDRLDRVGLETEA